MSSNMQWQAESWGYQSRSVWPGSGNHILAQYDEEAVVVYQAFRPEIAQYAVEHQRFLGCDFYNTTRMTWIKTNFLWMMFRCGWAAKARQDRVLAIWLKRSAFDSYLAHALSKGSVRGFQGTVRLQWDPDHNPDGSRHHRRKAVQLGLRNVPTFASGEDIARIEDVTPFVTQQRPIATARKHNGYEGLMVARERVYVPPADVRDLPSLHLSAPPVDDEHQGSSDPGSPRPST